MTEKVEQTCGAGERNRTVDLRITNALLYQLSYTGLATQYISAEPSPRLVVVLDRVAVHTRSLGRHHLAAQMQL